MMFVVPSTIRRGTLAVGSQVSWVVVPLLVSERPDVPR